MRIVFFRISRTIVLAAILAGAWSVSYAQSKIPGYLSVGGWIDGQYSYERQENNNKGVEASSTFHTRRARLDVKGGITDNIEFRLQADVSGTPKMIDAFVKCKINKQINFELGQFKTPFTLENQYSPLNQEGIDNAIVINKLAGFSDVLGGKRGAGRDIGIMLYGTAFDDNGASFPLLSYYLGVFNGNGINTKDDNQSKDLIGRIDIHPFVKELTLSASGVRGTYDNGVDKHARNNRYSFGGEYKDDALTLRSEFVHADIQYASASTEYVGFYVVAGYWFPIGESAKMRPVVRFDHYNEIGVIQKMKQTNYMAGLDIWPESHLRFQLNYTLVNRERYDKPGHLFQAMFSVKF